MIHDPLTKLQCSPTSDGAGAAIVASERFVDEHDLWAQRDRDRRAGDGHRPRLDVRRERRLHQDRRLRHEPRRRRASAYEEAQAGPEEVQVIELHDCFSANELITYEALGLAEEGHGHELVDAHGDHLRRRRSVVNPSGGLISKGHPLGATGLAQCCGADAGSCAARPTQRQVDGAKVALQHNIGLGGAAVVTVYRPAQS